MATVHLAADDFERTIADNHIVIVHFLASWVAPCHAVNPTFEAASEEHGDIVFAEVDVDAEVALATRLGIRAVPNLMFFRDGVCIFQRVGRLAPAAFAELVQKTIAGQGPEVSAEDRRGNTEVDARPKRSIRSPRHGHSWDPMAPSVIYDSDPAWLKMAKQNRNLKLLTDGWGDW